MEKKKYDDLKSKFEKTKKNIFDQWKACWMLDKNEAGHLNCFFELFILNYKCVYDAKEFYKSKNFHWKKAYMIMQALIFLAYLVFVLEIWFTNGKVLELIEKGMILALFTLMERLVLKWLDIKKFQETWARYSWHLHRLNREMLLFISGMAPYHKEDKKIVFAKKIIRIWDENENKFVYNIGEKEKSLTNNAEILK